MGVQNRSGRRAETMGDDDGMTAGSRRAPQRLALHRSISNEPFDAGRVELLLVDGQHVLKYNSAEVWSPPDPSGSAIHPELSGDRSTLSVVTDPSTGQAAKKEIFDVVEL